MSSRSYGYEEKRISPEKIEFSAQDNPRKKRPPIELIRQIDGSGVKDPVNVYRNPESGYIAVDGWQRVQVARQLGLTDIPCHVFHSKAQAQKAAIHTETRTPETDFQKYQRFFFYYRDLREERGLPHYQALQKAIKERGFKRWDAGERRILIFRLPPIVLSLMKEKDNRTDEEWDRLEKVIPNIRRFQKKLKITVAASIANLLVDRTVNDQLMTAGLCLGLKHRDAEKFVREVAKEPSVSPFKIFNRFMRKDKETITIRLQVTRKFKNKIDSICERAHKTVNELVREFFETIADK